MSVETSAGPPARTGRGARARALGAYGERCAERLLVADGMVVLDRNWRCRVGELDLVLADGAVVVAVEVKTRTSDRFGVPAASVGAAKVARLRRLLGCWLEARGHRAEQVRIDVVGVTLRPRGRPELEHLRGVA